MSDGKTNCSLWVLLWGLILFLRSLMFAPFLTVIDHFARLPASYCLMALMRFCHHHHYLHRRRHHRCCFFKSVGLLLLNYAWQQCRCWCRCGCGNYYSNDGGGGVAAAAALIKTSIYLIFHFFSSLLLLAVPSKWWPKHRQHTSIHLSCLEWVKIPIMCARCLLCIHPTVQ